MNDPTPTTPNGAPEPGPPRPPRKNIVGARLHPAGRTLEYDAAALMLELGERVVVEDQRGLMVATVSVPSAMRPVRGPLGRVLRRAEERDLRRLDSERKREAEALAFARERARARNLPMKVFRADILHGG